MSSELSIFYTHFPFSIFHFLQYLTVRAGVFLLLLSLLQLHDHRLDYQPQQPWHHHNLFTIATTNCVCVCAQTTCNGPLQQHLVHTTVAEDTEQRSEGQPFRHTNAESTGVRPSPTFVAFAPLINTQLDHPARPRICGRQQHESTFREKRGRFSLFGHLHSMT